MRIMAWFLLGVAGFLGGAALLYGATAGDEAGSVLLLLASGLAAMIGGYLLTQPGREPVEATGESAAEAEAYLPAASIWPFWVGLGATVLGHGLVLGLWGLIPGGLVTAIGVLGFSGQSRRRD